jgi:hypothetical protein
MKSLRSIVFVMKLLKIESIPFDINSVVGMTND